MNLTTAEMLLLCATGGLVGMLIIILGLLRSALDAHHAARSARHELTLCRIKVVTLENVIDGMVFLGADDPRSE